MSIRGRLAPRLEIGWAGDPRHGREGPKPAPITVAVVCPDMTGRRRCRMGGHIESPPPPRGRRSPGRGIGCATRLADMEQVSLGPLRVSRVGLGCNNFGRRLDLERTRAVVDAAIAAGHHVLRHGRHLRRAGRERADARRTPARPARAGGARHQVRRRHGRRRNGARGAGVRPARARAIARAPPDRPCRPALLPLARRGDADRRDPRRDGRARLGGQGAGDRRLEPHARAARRGGAGGADRGAPERVLAARARARARAPAPLPRAWHRLCARTSRLPQGS